MSEAIWKPIKEYELLYEISNTGKVRSKIKELKQLLVGKYYVVSLCKNGKSKQYYVHRLVAQHFLDNLDNLPQVNHKDENTYNNNVNNLEWCNGKYNCNYGKRNSIISNKNSSPRFNFKKVAQYDKQNNLIKQYDNIYEAYKETHKNMTEIKDCCEGKRKWAGTFIWKYINELKGDGSNGN